MSKRLIRSDEFGLYVLTGGYAFRPLAIAKREFFPKDAVYAAAVSGYASTGESKLEAGQRVNAHHRGGTTTAKVQDELWVSSSADPRYIEYVTVIAREEPAHG